MLPAGEGAVGVRYHWDRSWVWAAAGGGRPRGGDPRDQGSGWGALGFFPSCLVGGSKLRGSIYRGGNGAGTKGCGLMPVLPHSCHQRHHSPSTDPPGKAVPRPVPSCCPFLYPASHRVFLCF